MKRFLIFALCLAVLPVTLLCPLSVSAAVETTDELYDMPDIAEATESWVLYDPNDKNLSLQCNRQAEKVDVNDVSYLKDVKKLYHNKIKEK